MKRKIEFRGKVEFSNETDRLGNGEWAYGYYVSSIARQGGKWTEIIVPADEIGEIEERYLVDPETVGQFTGLYDSTPYEERSERFRDCKPEKWKGVKIFEGDIIRAWDDDRGEANGYIDYIDNAFCIVSETCEGKKASTPLWIYAEQFRVIDNVHDNPELLK